MFFWLLCAAVNDLRPYTGMGAYFLMSLVGRSRLQGPFDLNGR